jgi:hypothetical protein
MRLCYCQQQTELIADTYKKAVTYTSTCPSVHNDHDLHTLLQRSCAVSSGPMTKHQALNENKCTTVRQEVLYQCVNVQLSEDPHIHLHVLSTVDHGQQPRFGVLELRHGFRFIEPCHFTVYLAANIYVSFFGWNIWFHTFYRPQRPLGRAEV